MKDSGEEPKSAYEKRVSWYNIIMSGVNRYIEKAGSSEDKEKGINSFLTKAIVDLEKTVNPNYSIDKDPETRNRIAEISSQIFKDGGVKLRNYAGETRRNIIKFFSIDESPSDFFDKRHQAIIAQQEKMGIKYSTEPKLQSRPHTESKAPSTNTPKTTPSNTKSETPARSGSNSSKGGEFELKKVNNTKSETPSSSATDQAAIRARMQKIAAGAGNVEAQRGMMESKLDEKDRALLGNLKANNLPEVPKVWGGTKQGQKR